MFDYERVIPGLYHTLNDLTDLIENPPQYNFPVFNLLEHSE